MCVCALGGRAGGGGDVLGRCAVAVWGDGGRAWCGARVAWPGVWRVRVGACEWCAGVCGRGRVGEWVGRWVGGFVVVVVMVCCTGWCVRRR